MSHKALLSKEALQEFSSSWEVEVDIEINGQITRVKMTPLENQPPQPPQPQGQEQNARGNPLQPQPKISYPWKHKLQLPPLSPEMQSLIDKAQEMQKILAGKLQWGRSSQNVDEDKEIREQQENEPLKNMLDVDQETALQEVRRIMRDNLYERHTLSKSGKIETNRLAHYRTSPRLFTKKQGEKGKNYHVDIIMDVSGSMFSDECIGDAVKSVLNMGRILNKVAKVRVKMFGNCYVQMNFEEYEGLVEEAVEREDYDLIDEKLGGWSKMINSKAKRVDHVLDREVDMYKGIWYETTGGGDICTGTYEIWPVTESFEYMEKQDWEKIIFVLHDWAHSDYMSYEGNKDLASKGYDISVCGHNVNNHTEVTYRQEIRDAIESWVHIQSIGINTDCPEDDYGKANFVEINDSSEIYGVLVSSLNRMIWER